MRITNYPFRFAVLCLVLLFLFLGMWIGRFIPATQPWTLEHLRLLDDSFALEPASDISAVFARPAGTRCEIRLDFLDLPDPPQYHFAITLAGQNLVFSSDSPPPHDARLTVDTVTDIITLSLARCHPQADTPLVVETAAETLKTTFGAPVAIEPLPLQFVFTNPLHPAATPIQAWRRWDGAHTGPRGERHGLRGLLDAAERHQIPLTLYNANTPIVLSAIDSVGGTAQLRRMEAVGLLSLPSSSPPATSFLQFELNRSGLSIEARQRLLSSVSPRLHFSAASTPPSASPFPSVPPSASPFPSVPPSVSLFPSVPSSASPFPSAPPSASPFPAVSPSVSPFPSVPSSASPFPAVSPFPSVSPSVSPFHPLSNPLPIGGDLQHSPWGTYEYAEPSFAWLKARPYFAMVQPDLPVISTDKPYNPIDAAREMLSQSDPALAQNYAWLVPALEEAALWSENPAPVARCKDLCILASDQFYAVLNPRGGRLVFFFTGAEQIIGPTAQFFIGLSDRSQWDLSKGEAADPAQIMGAFSDADDVFRPYQTEITEKAIRFLSSDGREKTYRLTENGLEATFSPPIESQIPLALAPQTRFTPDWASKYRLQRPPQGILLEVADGPTVTIQVSAGQVRAVDSFLDAIPFITSPENPNLELAPGFFLPFPLTVVHFSAAEVSMTVRP